MTRLNILFLILFFSITLLQAQNKKTLVSPKYDSREYFVLEGSGKDMKIAHQSSMQSKPYPTKVTDYQNDKGKEKWNFTTQAGVKLVLFYEPKKGFEWATAELEDFRVSLGEEIYFESQDEQKLYFIPFNEEEAVFLWYDDEIDEEDDEKGILWVLKRVENNKYSYQQLQKQGSLTMIVKDYDAGTLEEAQITLNSSLTQIELKRKSGTTIFKLK
jgi:hypothetical protein